MISLRWLWALFGYADRTLCDHLPDGRSGFHEIKGKITYNDQERSGPLYTETKVEAYELLEGVETGLRPFRQGLHALDISFGKFFEDSGEDTASSLRGWGRHV